MKDGFPRGVQFTPVPNPLLASLLEQIDSIDELKVVLRIVHALHRERTIPASIGYDDLYSDRTVAAMLSCGGDQLEELVNVAVASAQARGIFLIARADSNVDRIYLNTEPVRRALNRKGIDFSIYADAPKTVSHRETWPGSQSAQPKLDAITFYEQNIAPITNVIAENIHHALEEHPEDEVLLAIRTAAEANVRNWNYVSAILRRWANEGRPEELDDEGYGTAGRNLQKDRSDEFYEEYLRRQRARGVH